MRRQSSVTDAGRFAAAPPRAPRRLRFQVRRAAGAAGRNGAPRGRDRFGRSWVGRRVTVVGLGKSGLAAAHLLCRVGARVRATDRSDSAALRAAAASLEARGAKRIELGRHSPSLLDAAELIIVSPGIGESTEPIQWAREQHLPILSEIELAFHFCAAPIIAVTGTNGKSTVVTLVANLLRAVGRSAVACGNLGVPFSSALERLTPESVAVVEVSSFQLLACEEFRPQVGLLLNLGTNHLDRHANQAAYLAAKARLFRRQTSRDWAVLNGRDPRLVALASRLRGRVVWFGSSRDNPPALRLAEATLRDLTENAQAVLQVGRLFGVPDALTLQVLREFPGLEHRLERVGVVRGVTFINDSKSTTPESLLFALSQIRGRVAVILGGRDKGLDFAPLGDALRATRIAGIVLIGEARPRLRAVCRGHPAVREHDTLEQAVPAAAALAGAGGTVLLSPACASFDMFRDFEDRGRAFKQIVRAFGVTGPGLGNREPRVEGAR